MCRAKKKLFAVKMRRITQLFAAPVKKASKNPLHFRLKKLHFSQINLSGIVVCCSFAANFKTVLWK